MRVRVNLLPKVSDVDVDHIAFYIGIRPHVFGEKLTGDDLAGVMHQILEQRVLARGQLNFVPTKKDTSSSCVDHEVAHVHDARAGQRLSADKRAHARKQLSETEGLGEVVVSTGIKADHHAILLIEGRKHQDRRSHAFSPEPPGNRETVHAGKHEIENDQIVVVISSIEIAVFAVKRRRNTVARLRQALLQEPRDTTVILYHEDAHGV